MEGGVAGLKMSKKQNTKCVAAGKAYHTQKVLLRARPIKHGRCYCGQGPSYTEGVAAGEAHHTQKVLLRARPIIHGRCCCGRGPSYTEGVSMGLIMRPQNTEGVAASEAHQNMQEVAVGLTRLSIAARSGVENIHAKMVSIHSDDIVIVVFGCIKPEDAGITLVHEHLSMTFESQMRPARQFPDLAKKPVTSDIMWWITHNPYSSYDNSHLLEEREAVRHEMMFFKSNGGGTIVENSTKGLERDVNFVVECAKESNVNMVLGTGYYVENSRPDTVSLTVEQMADYMRGEILEGCDGTTAKAGVIGEIGCSWPLLDSEKRSLQASAQLDCELGVGVSIHPGRDDKSPFEVVRIYLEAGGHADRLLMSHADRTFQDTATLMEFAKLGSYIDYDLFGIETSYYQSNESVDMPSDAQRIAFIRQLIEEGYQDRVTIAHDIHTKHRLMKFGGHGFSHILLHAAPRMLMRGISKTNLDKILKENPQRWLAFTKHNQ